MRGHDTCILFGPVHDLNYSNRMFSIVHGIVDVTVYFSTFQLHVIQNVVCLAPVVVCLL